MRVKRLSIILCILFLSLVSLAQGPYSHYVDQVDRYPFILISKADLQLTLIDSTGRAIRQYPVACGKIQGNKEGEDDFRTPEGIFSISKIYDFSNVEVEALPGAGKERDVYGPWFMRLKIPGGSTHIGIHGTKWPESVGGRSSHGCIRLTNEDICDLKDRVCAGTPVIILPEGTSPVLYRQERGEAPAHRTVTTFVEESEQPAVLGARTDWALIALGIALAGLVLILLISFVHSRVRR